MPWFLAQNAPKCVWRPGSARTRWGSLSAPPDRLAAKRGPTSKGRGREGKGWERRGKKGRGGKGGVEGRERGKGGEGRGEEGKESGRKGPSWLVANEAFFLKSASGYKVTLVISSYLEFLTIGYKTYVKMCMIINRKFSLKLKPEIEFILNW